MRRRNFATHFHVLLLAKLAFGFSPECPCINLEEHVGAFWSGENRSVEIDFQASGLNVNRSCFVSDRFLYPGNYGLGTCRKWDNGVPPYCEGNENTFCTRPWCYVNASACKDSTVAYYKSSYSSDSTGCELFYS